MKATSVIKPSVSNNDARRHNDGTLPPVVDRRVGSRRRALLSGIIAYNNRDNSISCSVRDYSDTGARVRVLEDANLPEHLYLILVRHRIAFQAEVMWYGQHEAGLRFIRRVELTDSMNLELVHLNELWREAAAIQSSCSRQET